MCDLFKDTLEREKIEKEPYINRIRVDNVLIMKPNVDHCLMLQTRPIFRAFCTFRSEQDGRLDILSSEAGVPSGLGKQLLPNLDLK